MKREIANGSETIRAKVFADLECGRQIDQFVTDILHHPDSNRSGILISGPKGTGKTFFVENCLKKFEQLHPVLVARHYEQHERIPYYGFKYCISDYLSKIYNQFTKKEVHYFARSLKKYLGDSFPLLLDYIPELSLITGQAPPLRRSHPTVENQLYPLFKRLFEFLADNSGKPVVFFTDDLQWMDASGINLLKYLLLNLGTEKLVWIGACRAPQNNTSPLKHLDEELGFNKRRIENIFLKGFTSPEVKKFLEATLDGECHDDLVNVCHKLSGGIASHLQALIDSLKVGDFLKFADGRWNCDKEIVEIRYSGQNTEAIVLDGVKNLTARSQEVLSTMACMGRFNKRTILEWLSGDGLVMEEILSEVGQAGLVAIGGNEIRFSDPQAGEMLYHSLENSKRISLHHQIAAMFYRRLEFLTPTEFVVMVSNFDQSLDLLRMGGKIQMAAELNYRAGKISQQENALDQARYFFKVSAELLKECPWDEVCDQVLPVYMERARVEYVLGEYDLAEIHLDYLLERIADPVKRARIFELKVTINNHLGRYLKVVRILKESLAELGLELPLNEERQSTEVKMLTGLLTLQEEGVSVDSPAHNLDLEARHAILKLLYVGGMGLHHSSDVLMRWAALQIILCSGVDRMSGVKAIGCVSYGRMLIISGEIQKGFEFGLKGLQINDNLNDVALRCRVFGVYAFYIQPWKKPFAESYSFLDQAILAGQKSGDLIGLYILKTHRLNLHLVSGLPLRDLPRLDFEQSHQRRELTYYITHYQNSLLEFLLGKSPVFAMPRHEPSWLAAQLTIQEEKFYRNYVWAHYYFLFGHYDLAAASAREADNNRKLQEGSPLLPANLLVWFLSMTQNWENYPEEQTKKMQSKLDEILLLFALWQEHAPANYRSAWCLMKAEYARIAGEYSKATSFYETSAESSGTNIYHLAITHELWAKHLLAVPGEFYNAWYHLTEAVRSFNEWGAVTKAKQIMQQYEAVIPPAEVDGKRLDENIDVETIQFELSGDMEVTSLVKKLMVLLLRISGSTQVVVELVRENGDRIHYDELSLLFGSKVKPDRKLTEGGAIVPVSLMLMALKSQTTIVVNDPRTEQGLRDMEIIQQRGVQSFLVLPVTINGHLSMVIYLENVFSGNWYIPERLRWTRIAANQGAVIIENARIHERSVKLNQELRKEMAEKERLSSMIEAQKDEHLRALVQTQDDERKRIASDLHDSLGSLLSTVKLRFNGLQDDFEKDIPDKFPRFRDTIGMLDDAIHELRQISHNMLPVSLRRFGLKAALETFVEQINASRQLDTRLQTFGLDRRLPEDVEVASYRICQELVQNVIKHAGASFVRIQVIDHGDSLNIIVEDNGRGIVKNEIARGFGFTTIQSKVDLFKGSFEIDSKPGKGAMVLVDIPIMS
jgi:signal transduction histidine kinase/predicted ATPase